MCLSFNPDILLLISRLKINKYVWVIKQEGIVLYVELVQKPVKNSQAASLNSESGLHTSRAAGGVGAILTASL